MISYFVMLFLVVLLAVEARHGGYGGHLTSKSWFWFLLLGVLAVNFIWEYFRGRTLLSRWAEANGYEILHSRRAILYAGPFTWRSRYQVVYSVRVRDRQGSDRTGWVRFGSYWAGLFSNQVDEWWKNEPEAKD